MNVKKEKTMLISVPVKNDWIRPLSPMRCIISPSIFASKNDMGNRMSLLKNSDMNAITVVDTVIDDRLRYEGEYQTNDTSGQHGQKKLSNKLPVGP